MGGADEEEKIPGSTYWAAWAPSASKAGVMAWFCCVSILGRGACSGAIVFGSSLYRCQIECSRVGLKAGAPWEVSQIFYALTLRVSLFSFYWTITTLFCSPLTLYNLFVSIYPHIARHLLSLCPLILSLRSQTMPIIHSNKAHNNELHQLNQIKKS